MAYTPRSEIITNQVFIGLPWKNVKRKYESCVDKLRSRKPLSFIIVGRSDGQDAEDLLQIIEGKIKTSSHAIFDATYGNANVSLEYGYAEALELKKALYLCTHSAASKTKEQPIISDLAGKRRHSYKNEAGLLKLLEAFCDEHAYTKRFEKWFKKEFSGRDKGTKKRNRSLALKVIHQLDGDGVARREDVVQELLGDQSDYQDSEIDRIIQQLHRAKLIYSEKGRYSKVYIA